MLHCPRCDAAHLVAASQGSNTAPEVLTLRRVEAETWNFRVEIGVSQASISALIIGVRMSRKAFLDMVRAYRQTIGRAYPQRDPIAVFKVLEECSTPIGTTQIAITKSTGVRIAEVNKIVSQAAEMGWVYRESSRSRSGRKAVVLTELGRKILAEFDRQCTVVCHSVDPQHQRASRPLISKRKRVAERCGLLPLRNTVSAASSRWRSGNQTAEATTGQGVKGSISTRIQCSNKASAKGVTRELRILSP